MTGESKHKDAIVGIAVYRASRLEALLDPLMLLLDESPPAHVLEPHRVVVAHPGMKPWLLRALARKRGVGSIVANVEIQLPSDWLDDLARQVLGESAVSLRPYRSESLRWRIHECLSDTDDAQVAAYLRGEDSARRRFQLADRVARLYARYLVYRPDWLDAWANGRDGVPEKTFLAPLWRRVRRHIGVPHRGEVLQRVVAHLQRGMPQSLGDEPLHVFGVSHLAASELAMLRAVAQHRLVVLYLPDPCTQYWAGLRTDVARLRELTALNILPPDADELFLEQGHPLLASWGRVGQQLMLALPEGADVRQDVRHWRDETLLSTPTNRLQQLQESLRHLDPALIEPRQPGDRAALEDRSLRVHVCHTRLRELEALRDALLRERRENPLLQPADIVVMAPNIQDYVPLLGAVFAEAGKHTGPLPYHLADVAVSRSQRIFSAFETLLALPQSRLTALEVMDLIGVPEIARALGLDQADIEILDACVQRARVAWGLDAEFREAFGVPGIAESTFAWGMDRLLAGYVFGAVTNDERLALPLPDASAVLPIEGVHGSQAEVVGALDRLLRELASLRRDLAQPRSASAWGVRLEALIDTLFRIDPADTDADAHEAVALLRRFVRVIETQATDAGLDPILEFDVVRDVLRECLASAPERQRWLLGGVTFCGMVPQRAIPFQVVAVLGLNDGEFPRAPGDGGLDLMARYPRLGDRDVRNDDRYLFLETVMSARTALHLSYLGEGVHDAKPRNPSAPLAELLSLLDARAGLRDKDDARPDRPWIVRHPLQPFDVRYFDGSDARLFSFRTDLARLAGDELRHARPFIAGAAVASALASAEIVCVSLAEVLAYYRDPARQILRNRLHLRLDALVDDSLRTSEPLEAKFAGIERVARRLFLDTASDPATRWFVSEAPPDWLRLDGLWPPGRAGEEAWRKESASVQTLLDIAGEHELFADGLPAAVPLPVDRDIGGFRVQGELTRVYRATDARWLFDVFPDKQNEDELTFKQRIGAFLEWALLRLGDEAGVSPVRMLLLTAGTKTPWQDALNRRDETFVAACRDGDDAAAAKFLADLQRRVEGLVAFWVSAQTQPAWYFPQTSWAAATSMDGEKTANAWSDGRGHGERDHSPGYAAVLARDARFEPGQADYTTLLTKARSLLTLIDLDADEAAHD